jgi:hypothetical protein
MASFVVRKTLFMTLGALVLAAAASLRAAHAQPEPAASDEGKLLAEIQEEESRNGPYSADLIGPLTALSELYRGAGNARFTVVAAERALEVVRVSRGLLSLDQGPFLRDLIDDDEARGDYASAWDREQALLALAAKNTDDLRTIPIYREIADKRMNLLRRYVAGEFPPQILLGCDGTSPAYRSSTSDCAHGNREYIASSILQDAWTNYWHAIEVFRERRLYSSDVLRELEMQIVRSAYEYLRYEQGAYAKEFRSYNEEVGRRCYLRLLEYAASSDRSADRAATAVEAADWDLMFARNGAALEAYAAALAELKQSADDASIEHLFSPPLPVVLPAFLPNPLDSGAAQDSTGHIDVAFEAGRFGDSRHIKVLGSTANASDDAKQRLVHTIKTSRFRPRTTNGELERTSRVVLRYFLRE